MCNYYLDPKLQEDTETIIAGLLRGRGVQSCSSDGVDKTVPDRQTGNDAVVCMLWLVFSNKLPGLI